VRGKKKSKENLLKAIETYKEYLADEWRKKAEEKLISLS